LLQQRQFGAKFNEDGSLIYEKASEGVFVPKELGRKQVGLLWNESGASFFASISTKPCKPMEYFT
jgi:hypothetical protein